MSRSLRTRLALALLAPAACVMADPGWLGGNPTGTEVAGPGTSSRPPPDPVDHQDLWHLGWGHSWQRPDRAIPEWLTGKGDQPRPLGLKGYPEGGLRVSAKHLPLHQILKIVATTAPGGPYLLDLPIDVGSRTAMLQAEGRLELVLEALQAASSTSIWLEGKTLRVRDGYRTPPWVAPSVARSGGGIAKEIKVDASGTELDALLRILATQIGKIAVVPAKFARLKGSVSVAGATLPQALEAIGCAYEVECFVDGPYLRVSDGWRPRVRPPVGTTPARSLRIKTGEGELGSVATLVAKLAGLIPCISGRLAKARLGALDLEAHLPEVLDTMVSRLGRIGSDIDAFVDGPYLRVQARHGNPALKPRELAALDLPERLLYPDPAKPRGLSGPDLFELEVDETGLCFTPGHHNCFPDPSGDVFDDDLGSDLGYEPPAGPGTAGGTGTSAYPGAYPGEFPVAGPDTTPGEASETAPDR